MSIVTLEQGFALKKIRQDVFENVQAPWSWYNLGRVVPGGILMGLATAAAWETVADGFFIDTLQTHFLSGPKPSGPPLQLHVQRLQDSGKFAVRAILIKQEGKPMAHVTCSFVRSAALTGRSMEHCTHRAVNDIIDEITNDDLEPGRNQSGPWMKFQRLSLKTADSNPDKSSHSALDSLVYTSAAKIDPPIKSSDPRIHCLGLIALSDYHIMDGTPTVHGLSLGIAPIGKPARKQSTLGDFSFGTSLNHTINFRLHDGFRADELCYIEVTCPWARKRRSNLQSRIFDRHGNLLATCVQEGYYVFKEESGKEKL